MRLAKSYHSFYSPLEVNRILLLLIISLFLIPISSMGQSIIYVDQNATGANDGSSWSNAYIYLQDALDEANANTGTNYEVRVAEGLYYPDEDMNGGHTDGDAGEAFTISRDDLKLFGGFPAGGGNRAPSSNITVLSGDIDQDDNTDGNGITQTHSDQVGDNSYHVLFIDDLNTTTLGGLTVTAGQADGLLDKKRGGGLLCKASFDCSPTLKNMRFLGNKAELGGAMYNAGQALISSPTIINSYFAGNLAFTNSGSNGNGGAIYNDGAEGGESNPTIINSIFTGNTAQSNGGGIYNDANSGTSEPAITNCTFANNSAATYGGAIINVDAPPTITNNILYGNTASSGGNQICNVLAKADPIISYTLIEGGIVGIKELSGSSTVNNGNNIDFAPKFADSDGADNDTGTGDDDLRLASGSPAIDAGTPDTTGLNLPEMDIGNDPRIKKTVDLGAYESGTSVTITGNEAWRMLGSPLDGSTYSELLDEIWTQGISNSDEPAASAPNVYVWDESIPGFTAPSDMNDPLSNGTGVLAYIYADDDYDGNVEGFPKKLSLAGSEPGSPVSIAVSANDSGSNGIDGDEGWNYIANPYFVPIKVDEVLSAARTVNSNLNTNVYIWDSNKTGGAGYQVLAEANGEVIAPFQGFWIRYTQDGVNGSFTLDKAQAKGTGGMFYKQKRKAPNVELRLSAETYSDTFVLHFENNGSVKTGLDLTDAYELEPLAGNYVQLFGLADQAVRLTENRVPQGLKRTLEIPIDFENNSPHQTLNLRWSLVDIPTGLTITLHDNLRDEAIQLGQRTQYSFGSKREKVSADNSKKITTPRLTAKGSSETDRTRFVLEIDTGSNASSDLPSELHLKQNYPNPFNPATVIEYAVPEKSEVSLEVFDMLGQKVAALVNEQKSAGNYRITFDASGLNLSSGLYVYRLQVGGKVLTKKMTLIK